MMKNKFSQLFKSTILLLVAACFVTTLLQAQTKQFLLALSKHEHSLNIVDPATLKILGKVPVGEDPHEVVASPDGKNAYVSIYGFGKLHTINVIDLVAQKHLDDINTEPLYGPHGLHFAAGKLWFTVEGSKAFSCYNPITKKIEWAMGTGQDRTHMIYATADAKEIYTTNVASGTVSILQQTPVKPGTYVPSGGSRNGENWEQTIIPVSKNSEGFDVSPDGKQMWVAGGNGKVHIIDLAAKKLVDSIDAKANASNRLKFTPDGKMVFVSCLEKLVVIDTETKKPVKELNLGRGCAGIAMQPDGTRAYVSSSISNYISVIDLKTLEVIGKIDVGGEPDGLGWAVQAL